MARLPASGAQPAGGPAQASRGGLLSRVGGSRNGAILAAGATVAVVGLLSVLRGKTKTPPPADQTVTQAGAFDSGPYDMWDQWQQQYEGLAGRVSTLENPPTPDPIPKPPPTVPIPRPVPLPAPLPKPPVVKPPVRVATPPKAAPKPKTVTVKKGDTLSGIAAKYHISMATLKKLNPVYWTNPKYKQGNEIWAGDKVKV